MGMKSLLLRIMEKLCTNKNHSYKHNEQINKHNIDNSECFGVKYVKDLFLVEIYRKITFTHYVVMSDFYLYII
jgi:hypothetical protein